MTWQEKFQKLSTLKVVNTNLFISILWSESTKCWYISNSEGLVLYAEMDDHSETFSCHNKSIEDSVEEYWDMFTSHTISVERWHWKGQKNTLKLGTVKYIDGEFVVEFPTIPIEVY
jgi:hypothetical protein